MMTTTSADTSADGEHSLDASLSLVEDMVATAVRFDRRCTWMGAVPSASTSLSSSGRLTFATLGPDLYGGTSGVALFLGSAAAVARSHEFETIALGAMRHAIDHRARLAEAPFGLYAGLAGVAYATTVLGGVLDDQRLLRAGRGIVRELNAVRCHRFDVVSGAAGSIVGLLASRDAIGGRAMTLATELGDVLINAARAEGNGLWWPDPDIPGQRGLTGLAHGAAGIGWALHELAAASGLTRFREAGDRAFAYERRWMCPDGSNWLDLRGIPHRFKPDRYSLDAGLAWCHGAPGILLTRTRAWMLTGSTDHLDEAKLAMATTRTAIAKQIASERSGKSLCHGLAGNTAALSLAATNLGLQRSDRALESAAARILGNAADHLADQDADTPGLMLGSAGVGMFLLSCTQPGICAPLLIHHD